MCIGFVRDVEQNVCFGSAELFSTFYLGFAAQAAKTAAVAPY